MCSDGFRAVSDHLVLLPVWRAETLVARFRAVSNRLVLLRRVDAKSSLCFRAVLNHLVLLPLPVSPYSRQVSQPCQITWFSYLPTAYSPNVPVSESCQITWFSYKPLAVIVGGAVSQPCQITWFFCDSSRSRVELPGSLTAGSRK